PDPYFEMGMRHPELPQLRCNLSTDYGIEESKIFERAFKQIKTPKILNYREDKLIRQLLNQLSEKCYSVHDQLSNQGAEKRSQKPYWLAMSLQQGEEVGLVSIAGRRKRELEDLSQNLEAAALETRAYLERYDLARTLTRACGTPRVQEPPDSDRKTLFDASRRKVARMANESDRTFCLEWKPLLEDVRSSLDRIGAPNSLNETERRSFDECVVPALGSPYYSPLMEMRAVRFLRSIKGHPAEKMKRKVQPGGDERPTFGRVTSYDEQMKLIEEDLRW
ncbi:unnamed protein product, partial [marine sediment metagenome]